MTETAAGSQVELDLGTCPDDELAKLIYIAGGDKYPEEETAIKEDIGKIIAAVRKKFTLFLRAGVKNNEATRKSVVEKGLDEWFLKERLKKVHDRYTTFMNSGRPTAVSGWSTPHPLEKFSRYYRNWKKIEELGVIPGGYVLLEEPIGEDKKKKHVRTEAKYVVTIGIDCRLYVSGGPESTNRRWALALNCTRVLMPEEALAIQAASPQKLAKKKSAKTGVPSNAEKEAAEAAAAGYEAEHPLRKRPIKKGLFMRRPPSGGR